MKWNGKKKILKWNEAILFGCFKINKWKEIECKWHCLRVT